MSLKQRISLGVVAALVIAAIYGFTSWRREKDFKPLYTGVAPEDAATIVQKIKESGSEYRLSEVGGVISVPSAKVAELRLQMAAAGLPKSGRIGYELFDKTNFGATEFVEHINFNRALEGELERSIASLAAVEQARVHLTPAKESVFVESREPAKASVVLRLRTANGLLPQNVAAIQQLVASAVEGLNSDDVAVVDTRGMLLSRRKLSADQEASDAAFEHRHRVEADLLQKINASLDPLLGHDKFRAGVTVECDLNSSEQSEETYDPTKSVMTNSQKSEEVTAGGSVAGIPGTATNLPKPAGTSARVAGPTNTTSRRTENISYESSHVMRKTRIPDGEVKRMSISVLLDQRMEWQGKGKDRKAVPVPPTPETVKAVHDLVAGITGFVPDRGDQLTVETLPFQTTLEGFAPEASPTDVKKPLTWKDQLKNPTVMIAAGVGAGVVLLLALGAFFLMRKKKGSGSGHGHSGSVEMGAALTEGGSSSSPAKAALAGANAAEQMEATRAAQELEAMAAIAALKLPTSSTQKSNLLVKEIRESTTKDATMTAHVLSTLLHEKG
ncbi:MAG: flagellar M-ring protein FliF [Rhodospirillales bacterium]|nr:flagellar M-ring protein FliF [Acetobacter sp.]